MVTLIFVSESKMTPSTWVSGIDVGKVPIITPLGNSYKELLKKSGDDKILTSNPTCYFIWREVLWHVDWSPHGGITSQTLFWCLQKMHKLELFDREKGVLPFMLRDGHQPRFEVFFFAVYTGWATQMVFVHWCSICYWSLAGWSVLVGQVLNQINIQDNIRV